MRNHGCNPCEVQTHDPQVARQTPYPLPSTTILFFVYIAGNRISGQILHHYMIANLDPYAIDRAAMLHRSAAGNGESLICGDNTGDFQFEFQWKPL